MAQIKIRNMKVGRRGTAKENLPNNWEDLNINEFKIPQGKSIHVFGGNTTNREDAANGNAKIIQSLISPEQLDKVKLYSFSYVNEPLRSNGYLSQDYEDSAAQLYEQTYKPLLYDDKGYMKEAKGVEQAFGKMIFVAHCGGSNFVNIIIDKFHENLREKYSEKEADLLISKIQYIAYAPNQMPNYNLNGCFITPYCDPSYSWDRALQVSKNQKVEVDYPKGIIKKILRSQKQGSLIEFFGDVFKEVRLITFKVGQSTYFIPDKMNPRTNIGDHSIECLGKTSILNSGTDLEDTAKLTSFAAKVYLNEYLKQGMMNVKQGFSSVVDKIKEKVPAAQRGE